jgi:S1-C subfamily serine protease
MPNTYPVDLKSLSASLSAAVSEAAGRVVSVHSRGGRPSSGIIWQTGLVVTAEEALDHEEDFRVTLPTGNTVEAEMVGRDPSTDVGLLRLATDKAEAWAQSPTPAVGSLTLAIGRGDESPIAALGLVAEIGGPWRSMRGGRIDARIRLGLSLPLRVEGGAVIVPDGSLIGLAVTGPRGRALVIPSSTVGKAVAALLEKGYVARGFLGFELRSLRRRGGGPGVIVVEVEATSPAEQAGFVVGDIITTWDGEPIRTAFDVARRLGTDSIGENATIGVLRGGAALEVPVRVGERPRT